MWRTKDPSPLLVAYKADYFIGMMTDGGVLIAFVDGERTVEHVHTLSRHMERDLAEQVPGLRFRIVPVWGPEEPPASAAQGELADEAAAEPALEV